MVDVVSAQKRSEMMSGIRNKDTRPEKIIRSALHLKGYRYRLHVKKMPGKPDIVMPKFKAVIFVHGCFWHGHDCHLFKWPSSRIEFWRNKIGRNQKNDLITERELGTEGWRVLTIWECALKGRKRKPLTGIIKIASAWLKGNRKKLVIRGKK